MSNSRGASPIIPDRWLIGAVLLLTMGVVALYIMSSFQPGSAFRPGDPEGHLLGVAGALLMGIGLLYPLFKRTSHLSPLRPWWHQLHLLLGLVGGSMAVLHSAGRLGKAPTLVLLAAVGIMALGLYGRMLAGRLAYRGFASDHELFLPADPARPRAALRIVKEKERMLLALEPRATEGTFSLTPGHWLRHPLASAGFALLALQEEQLVLQTRSLSWGPVLLLQRYWRFFHLLLVALLLLGVLAHSIMVLFFAGYIAEGSEPYWWYIRR